MIDRDHDRMLDILEIIGRIERDMAGVSRETFVADHVLSDAITYRVMAISDSARRVSEALRARRPEIAWRDAVAMRNKLAHDYLDYDADVVWTTVARDLPRLAAVCRAEVESGANAAGIKL